MCDTFVKGDSRNLPKVDMVMILEYISTSSHHSVAEIRGAKILISSRDSYIDTAVGYVKVSRTATLCTVKAKIVPEHRINKKLYNVTCNIDEHKDVIIDSVCEDCTSSAGGCKHSLLLLFWLAKRSSEPSTTAVTCYWNKPSLSDATTQHIISKDIFPKAKNPKPMPKDNSILCEFAEECKQRNIGHSLILKYCEGFKSNSKNVFDIMLQFIDDETVHDYANFRCYLQNIINDEIINDISTKTLGQSESKYWFNIRQGRLTASKLFEAAHCNTDGALVQNILGGYKLPETQAILRGRRLENRVLEVIKHELGSDIKKSGFYLINGILGASPDGVGEDFVVEIKCPASEKAVHSYIQNGITSKKFL